MKSHFPGYYDLDEAEYERIWKSGTFAIDANVLLNLYRYPENPRRNLLDAFARLGDRLWLPFQAALEFQRNRLPVIAEQKKRFGEVRELVESLLPKLEGDFGRLQLRDRHAVIDPDSLISAILPPIQKYLDELEQLEGKQPDVYEADETREEIDKLLADRIGDPFSQEEIENIYKEGEERYKLGIPPGYLDRNKEKENLPNYSYAGIIYESKFGDLVIWKQIIEHAKKNNKNPIIFLTDDEKPDWWWEIESHGKKRIGPRPELVSEIKKESDIPLFYMYNTERFLKYAKEYLDVDVTEESLDQVRDVAKRASVASTYEAFRHEALEAEEAVRAWLTVQYPTYKITTKTGWPDFELRDQSSEDAFGVEVVNVRSAIGAAMRLRDRMYRGYYELKVKNYSKFEFVIAIGAEENWEQDYYTIKRRLSIPPEICVIYGRITRENEQPPKFVPLGEMQP